MNNINASVTTVIDEPCGTQEIVLAYHITPVINDIQVKGSISIKENLRDLIPSQLYCPKT